ncbi:hypothetical protein [Deefgea salmonis]|uniref:Uncharacterized protein n=1 Tax=Deefgea salmonis TaxID=2875502 RepID=A0ABS8BKX8_9NEIS|nr:hypothetical protein [Deefgea salmonis]MCB5196378.1 hypothetical protein [Deefgea salmonis]
MPSLTINHAKLSTETARNKVSIILTSSVDVGLIERFTIIAWRKQNDTTAQLCLVFEAHRQWVLAYWKSPQPLSKGAVATMAVYSRKAKSELMAVGYYSGISAASA